MDSPSFNQNSSNSIADIADRVLQELHIENRLNNDKDIFSFTENEEHEFEFPLFCVDSNSLETLNSNTMYDEQISPKYPLFDQSLLQDINLLIEDCNNSASTSSSDTDDLDLLSPETYCVWEPKKLEKTPRGKHKKSNSLSIGVGNTSKKWNVRDVLFKRSYSDDNYTVNTSPVVLFLPPVSPKMKKNNEKVSITKSEKNPKVGSYNKPENKLRPTYIGKIGNIIRLPAYLPYRQDQIGVYVEANEKQEVKKRGWLRGY
ncbi:hypothetical protein CTI12_AA504860 [Artemisia annua]|uniref:Uncharacterized protein n=1 Tax=Artemisia annua TaxID=35608 RepID=A0A2U1LBK4_ARTAN|nr:hypothetical protein CTI12_AA504860 [Artemisia annua]